MHNHLLFRSHPGDRIYDRNHVIKWSYLVLTIFKAYFIVMTFMHLGDERKSLKYVILAPYILFICYLIFIALTEALAVGDAWATYGA